MGATQRKRRNFWGWIDYYIRKCEQPSGKCCAHFLIRGRKQKYAPTRAISKTKKTALLNKITNISYSLNWLKGAINEILTLAKVR